MKPLWSRRWLTALATSVGCLASGLTAAGQAADAPGVRSLTTLNGRPVLDLTPAPASVGYQLLHAPTVDGTYVPDAEAVQSGLQLSGGLLGDANRFFRVGSVPMDAETLGVTTLLHRIAYGPTPDELERVRAMGTAAYTNEQLAPETITEALDVAPGGPQWKQVIASGTATTSGGQTRVYIFMDGPGDAYVDNLRLVLGSSDNGTQTNLLTNGSFEAGLAGTWTVSTNLETSAVTADFSQSGNNCLHVIDSTGGESQSTSIYQVITPTIAVGTPITLSFWYRTSAEDSKLVVRLGGSGISVATGLSGQDNSPAPIFAKLLAGEGTLTDLRAWHILHAVQAKRQLLEVFRQFLENHFVTQISKTRDYFDNRGYDTEQSDPISTRTELVENLRWQDALLRPNVNFLDLLRISAESPAMIIYLDTVGSRGDGNEGFG